MLIVLKNEDFQACSANVYTHKLVWSQLTEKVLTKVNTSTQYLNKWSTPM